MKWEKKWVYTADGPRQVEAMHHPEHKTYVIKVNHCIRASLPDHAVFDTSAAAVQAFKDGKIKMPEDER